MKLNEPRKCPECGELLVGRSDKKYCSDQCRFIANHKAKNIRDWPINEVNKALRNNRMILKTLSPAGKSIVRKEVLDAMQFDASIFSTIFVTRKKQIYYLCYDYGFTPILENGVQKALIISRQDYMGKWDPWRYIYKEQE